MKDPKVLSYPLVDMSELNRCLPCGDAPCERACVPGRKSFQVRKIESTYPLSPREPCLETNQR